MKVRCNAGGAGKIRSGAAMSYPGGMAGAARRYFSERCPSGKITDV